MTDLNECHNVIFISFKIRLLAFDPEIKLLAEFPLNGKWKATNVADSAFFSRCKGCFNKSSLEIWESVFLWTSEDKLTGGALLHVSEARQVVLKTNHT